VDNPYISMIATAYGLLILRLIGSTHPTFLKHKEEIINTLLDMRLQDNGWSGSSQGITGRPEATAWAILALHEWGFDSDVLLGLKSLERMFENGADPEAKKFVFTLSLVVSTVSRVCPGSPLLKDLSKILVDTAARDRNGLVKYWGKYTFLYAETWSSGFDSSVLHTAHAMLALLAANKASCGEVGLPPEELISAQKWLLEQPQWANSHETIYRSTGVSKYEPLHVNHYTAPWVVAALLESGASPSENKIVAVIKELAEAAENGLWNWGEEKHPIWATYDALMALTEFALRCSLL